MKGRGRNAIHRQVGSCPADLPVGGTKRYSIPTEMLRIPMISAAQKPQQSRDIVAPGRDALFDLISI